MEMKIWVIKKRKSLKRVLPQCWWCRIKTCVFVCDGATCGKDYRGLPWVSLAYWCFFIYISFFMCAFVRVCVSTHLFGFSWRPEQRGIGKAGCGVIYWFLITAIYGQIGHRGAEPVLITNNEWWLEGSTQMWREKNKGSKAGNRKEKRWCVLWGPTALC